MSGPRAPVWLGDEASIRALLGAVVDRFDGQPGAERARAIVLPALRHLPELGRNDAAADQVWALIEDLRDLGILSIRAGRREVYDAPWENAKLAFAPASESVLREWLGRPATVSVMERWRAAVNALADRFPGGPAALWSRRIQVAGKSPEQVVAALASLAQIKQPATLRQLSTHAFWGDSKLLDERVELIAALFPDLPLRERPVVVSAYLPEHIEGVLFIENQDSYTAALTGEPPAARRQALVYMAGFRGAAVRIRASDGACLHFAGPGAASGAAAFERWWFAAGDQTEDLAWRDTMAFWGDLDFAGMQILKALRERFGEVSAWRPGYEPMLRHLRARERAELAQDLAGSVRGGVDFQGQVDPGATGCPYADAELLPAIRRWGFWHQERIGPAPGSLC